MAEAIRSACESKAVSCGATALNVLLAQWLETTELWGAEVTGGRSRHQENSSLDDGGAVC